MKPDEKEQALLQALERLETSLETPVVPGEMADWVEAVDKALTALEPLLRERIQRTHKPALAEIAKEDPGLVRRVEQLREGDGQIAERLDAVRAQVDRLGKAAPRMEPDEARLDNEITEMAEQGLAFVIQVRTQEVAIRTWLMEAVDRDRGDVD